MAIMAVVRGRLQICEFGLVVEVRRGGSVTNGATLPRFCILDTPSNILKKTLKFNITDILW